MFQNFKNVLKLMGYFLLVMILIGFITTQMGVVYTVVLTVFFFIGFYFDPIDKYYNEIVFKTFYFIMIFVIPVSVFTYKLFVI
jgi:hypothetical protein